VSSIWMAPKPMAVPRPTMQALRAAFLAHELGRPVRLQWMRNEETGWDTKGPAYVFQAARAGSTQKGKVVALEYDACAADYKPCRLQ